MRAGRSRQLGRGPGWSPAPAPPVPKGRPRLPARRALAELLAALTLLAGCAHLPTPSRRAAGATPPAADSATAALWRFDELGDQTVADATPARLDAVAGLDTRVEFGRFGRARSFTCSANSFVLAPASPLLDLRSPFTIEMWLEPRSYPSLALGALVSRLQDAGNQRSFILALTGTKTAPVNQPPHPLFGADPRLQAAEAGRLWFAFVPEGAWSGLYSFLSVGTVELGRWTHVAVTYDGAAVRFFLDGRLDSQHAASGEPARVQAPLMIGNYFEPGYLSDFSGQLRVEPARSPPYVFPYDGLVDELRISSVAREWFGAGGAR